MAKKQRPSFPPIYTGEPTNEARAQWGKLAIDVHAAQCGGSDEPESDLTDLLANLMHYAAQEKISFYRCLASGQGHYRAERSEAALRKEG